MNYNNINFLTNINDEKSFLKRRNNGLLLSDYQVEILSRYNINYDKFNNLKSLIYEIEKYINNAFENIDDLDNLSKELSEMDYYKNTNK